MAFTYVRHNSPCLRQGEIIDNLFEFKLQIPTQESIDYVRERAKFDPIIHPSVILVSQDCDLEWDYKARFEGASVHKLIAHILCCSLFSRYEITDETKQKSRMFELVKQNQDERYHHFVPAPYGIPDLYMDFKKLITIPPYWLYKGLERPDTYKLKREAVVPVIYLQQVMHRFFGFQSRIGTPD